MLFRGSVIVKGWIRAILVNFNSNTIINFSILSTGNDETMLINIYIKNTDYVN